MQQIKFCNDKNQRTYGEKKVIRNTNNTVSSFKVLSLVYPGIPTTIKTMTMGVNITTIVYLRVLIIQIGSTIILMVVEA